MTDIASQTLSSKIITSKLSSAMTLSVGQKYACLIGQKTETRKVLSGKFFAQHSQNWVATSTLPS